MSGSILAPLPSDPWQAQMSEKCRRGWWPRWLRGRLRLGPGWQCCRGSSARRWPCSSCAGALRAACTGGRGDLSSGAPIGG